MVISGSRAAIDIGSNSLLLLVQDGDGATLHDEATVVGLGRGLGDQGLFRLDRMDTAIDVLTRYATTADSLGVAPAEVHAVATSAARRALNATSFFDRVRAATGLKVAVIAGQQEARLTWLGASAGLSLPPGRLAVIDLGGGSTEVVVGSDHSLDLRTSLELGAVRATEQFFGEHPGRYDPRDLSRLRAQVRDSCAEVDGITHPRTVIAVGGTATTLSAMSLGLVTWDRDRVHGSRLTRADLRRWIDRLLASSHDDRLSWAAVSPQRADYLLAGACILEAVLTSLSRESMLVSDGGLRHGLLKQSHDLPVLSG